MLCCPCRWEGGGSKLPSLNRPLHGIEHRIIPISSIYTHRSYPTYPTYKRVLHADEFSRHACPLYGLLLLWRSTKELEKRQIALLQEKQLTVPVAEE